MKNVFLLAAVVIGLAISANAQNPSCFPRKAGDTVVNSGTVVRIIKVTGGYSGAVLQAKSTKISGTNGGTITVAGSVDGVNYETIGSAYTVTDVASQAKIFYISAPLPAYIRVTQAGTGTMSAVSDLCLVFRKYQPN